MKTGNQKRKYACNRYEDIPKQLNKVLDKFGDDENVQILAYWVNKLQKDRATFRKKAVKYDELQSILEEYNVTPEILREVLLTGQMFRNQPTFDECIKEWKKRGWEYCYDDYYNWHCFTNKKENDTISIDSKDNKYWTSEMTFIDIKLNNLLHKTLKALEVEE